MDAFKALAAQQGCSADGTAAARNPMSQFVNSAMGGDGGVMARGPRGPMQARGGMNAIDEGMAAGMGMKQQARGPMLQQTPQMVREFEQMRAAGNLQGAGPVMAGPRGPMVRPAGGDWANQFERMHMGGPQFAPNPAMQAAFHQSFGVNGPRPMGQRWVNQMAARPRGPTGMDKAWNAGAKESIPVSTEWANEMAAPKEPANADAWAKEMAKADEQQVRSIRVHG